MDYIFRVAYLDRDWDAALHKHTILCAYATFAHALNFMVIAGEAEAHTKEKQYLWLGTPSCGIAPGGLLVNKETLPEELCATKLFRCTNRTSQGFVLEALNNEQPCRCFFTQGGVESGSPELFIPCHPARRTPSFEVLNQLEELLFLQGNTASPFLETTPETNALELHLHRQASLRGQNACDALLHTHDAPQHTSEGLAPLIGFGKGSTPSGDDFLLGALALARACGALGDGEPAVAEAICRLASQTTTVSKQYLLSGAEGRFAAHLVALVRALFEEEQNITAPPLTHTMENSDMTKGISSTNEKSTICMSATLAAQKKCLPSQKDTLTQLVEDLISHGSTSGTDTLAGVICMGRTILAR